MQLCNQVVTSWRSCRWRTSDSFRRSIEECKALVFIGYRTIRRKSRRVYMGSGIGHSCIGYLPSWNSWLERQDHACKLLQVWWQASDSALPFMGTDWPPETEVPLPGILWRIGVWIKLAICHSDDQREEESRKRPRVCYRDSSLHFVPFWMTKEMEFKEKYLW